MKITRRELMRIAGGAILFSMLPIGMQNIIRARIYPEEVPGSGNLSDAERDKIDTDAYLSSCARCGICVSVCPHNALRYSSIMVPILTPETSSRCPSVKECYRCMEECPTDAIKNAYRAFAPDETALGKKQEILGEA